MAFAHLIITKCMNIRNTNENHTCLNALPPSRQHVPWDGAAKCSDECFKSECQILDPEKECQGMNLTLTGAGATNILLT